MMVAKLLTVSMLNGGIILCAAVNRVMYSRKNNSKTVKQF